MEQESGRAKLTIYHDRFLADAFSFAETAVSGGISMEEQETKVCAKCGQGLVLVAFYRHKTNGRVKTCAACLTQERKEHQEQEAQRWAIRQAERAAEQARLEALQAERSRLFAEEMARQQEEVERQVEAWLDAQPSRACIVCGQVHPARQFKLDSIGYRAGMVHPQLYKRCHACLVLYREMLAKKTAQACVLCGQPAEPFEWPHDYHYSLRLCCRTCRPAFDALAPGHKRFYIQSRLNKLFPAPQVIYGEKDPRTNEIRYIGRTGNATRRHTEHQNDISALPAQHMVYEAGTWKETSWYSRANWMHDLAELGLQPVQEILAEVHPAPFVVEMEQRYIWHGIHQGWPLVNKEAVLRRDIHHIRDYQGNILEAPFEELVNACILFGSSLETFIRQWCG